MIKGEKIAGMLVHAPFESNKMENLILGVEINYSVNKNQPKNSISEWTKSSSTIGKKIEINIDDKITKGEAIRIDAVSYTHLTLPTTPYV